MAMTRTIKGRQIYCYGLGTLYQKDICSTLGNAPDCSGWTSALKEAGINNSGIYNSYFTASHITHTSKAHKIKHLFYLFFKKGLRISRINITKIIFLKHGRKI